MPSGQQLQKSGLQMSVQTLFWEISVSCSKAEGEHKDGIIWPMFPESISIASRCVPNPKPTSKVKSPGLASRSLSQKSWGCVSVICLCSVLRVVIYQALSLSLLQFHGTQQCNASPLGYQDQEIKRYPLGRSCKNQDMRCKNWDTRHK